MNAQMKALVEERDYLNAMMFKVANEALPFTVTIDDMQAPESVTSKARWGMSSYITMRLRELHAAIHELKKENNA